MTPLLSADGEREGQLYEGHEYFVEGSVENVSIVSVPETITEGMAGKLKAYLQSELKKDVVIITHNTMFMKVARLNPTETGKVVKRVASTPPKPTGLVDPQGNLLN